MSDGEDHAIDSGSDHADSLHDSGLGSDSDGLEDFTDWWQHVHPANNIVDEDDISTVCFGSDVDSLYHQRVGDYPDDDLETIAYGSDSDIFADSESSNGTVADYQQTYQCMICHAIPNTITAVEINDAWLLDGHCRINVDGVDYLVCQIVNMHSTQVALLVMSCSIIWMRVMSTSVMCAVSASHETFKLDMLLLSP
jgi:hypothetical protein